MGRSDEHEAPLPAEEVCLTDSLRLGHRCFALIGPSLIHIDWVITDLLPWGITNCHLLGHH
jgi:hypothetical protein